MPTNKEAEVGDC